ncbi:MAG: MarR family transcriptional regulator [Clostridiales bacterium]|jgi:DNA-binding MarR family transcriptional regulator|nr:MarR family transcriptional regulator [Clostridiales bacterium]MDW7660135.1 MarR family transcriptional regulator [Bacillota bacterium]
MNDKYDSLLLKNQLCFPLYAVSKNIISMYKPYLDPLGLTYTQYITMMVLWEQDDVMVKTLGERLFLDSGTLTPVLKKLEAQNYITRKRGTENERNVYIKLTPVGLALRDKALEVPKQIVQCLDISPEDAKTLYKILYKILD